MPAASSDRGQQKSKTHCKEPLAFTFTFTLLVGLLLL